MSQSSADVAQREGPSPERLAAKHQQALFGDYFQVLEVARDAGDLAVARAIASLTEEFDPTLGEQLAPADQSKLNLVATVLRDAALVLGDPALRARYRVQQRSPR